MTARLSEMFAKAHAEKRLALMPFMTAGYPDLDTSYKLMLAMVESGADALEVGIPFSDPLAEGPTIQRSSYAALQAGTTPGDAIDIVARLRKAGVAVPLIVMGYFNSFLAEGEERFVSAAAQAGADGLIISDLPPEESDGTLAICRKNGLDLIYLAAPTSDEARISEILQRAGGFVYCVGVVGVTGARTALAAELTGFLQGLRTKTNLPLAVGFGISKREHIKALSGLADAAIVGSAVIDIVESSPEEERVKRVRDYVEVLTGRMEAPA